MKRSETNPIEVLFLSWESPWPALGGGALRTLGLLKELSKSHAIELLVLSHKPLSLAQTDNLCDYAAAVTRVPMAVNTLHDKLRILLRMFWYRMPYHSAVVAHSFGRFPGLGKRIRSFPGVVYASFSHWGFLLGPSKACNWILDQHNADVDFWRVYASQATTWWRKMGALANFRLAATHFPQVYSNVGCIVSVCEADRQLTLSLANGTPVEVIENGVDCSYFEPDRKVASNTPRLLFTGTSAPRNVTALRQFVGDVWPLVKDERSDAELLIAGNFRQQSQVEFSRDIGIRFTGKVDDIRPYFNSSAVFVSPFEETHGSKLKIAEAMAMGMPIVSTPAGVRGFDLVNHESVLIAETPEHFAKLIVRLLGDYELQKKLGTKARLVALTTIDWRVLGDRLRRLVAKTVDNCDI